MSEPSNAAPPVSLTLALNLDTGQRVRRSRWLNARKAAAVLPARVAGGRCAGDTADLEPAARVSALAGSHVEVQREFVGMRPDLDRHDLVLALVGDPGLDQVRGETPALRKVLVVRLEPVDHVGQRRGRLWDARGLVRRKLVEVLVHRGLRLDLVLDPLE